MRPSSDGRMPLPIVFSHRAIRSLAQNDIRWIRANRASRTDIVPRLHRLAVMFLDIVQHRERNIASLAMIAGILRDVVPCHGKPGVGLAAVPCRNPDGWL